MASRLLVSRRLRLAKKFRQYRFSSREMVGSFWLSKQPWIGSRTLHLDGFPEVGVEALSVRQEPLQIAERDL